jgi:hypothetical protein
MVFRRVRDGRLIRLLRCDDELVHYDNWRADRQAWEMRDVTALARQTVFYHHVPTSFLLQYATWVRSEPLSPGETALHRPDLPHVLARSTNGSWATGEPGVVTGPERIPAAQLHLVPFGPDGNTRPGVTVAADNGDSFTPAGILAKAVVLQRSVTGGGRAVDGIGVYRLGLHRGRPAYYLSGS